MGCANTVASRSEKKFAGFAQTERGEVVYVNVSLQKDDEEITPLQPHHYNTEKADNSGASPPQAFSSEEDWSQKKIYSSIPERGRRNTRQLMNRAGTLELDKIELKNEIISKSDNIGSIEGSNNYQKAPVEFTLENIEGILLLTDPRAVNSFAEIPPKNTEDKNNISLIEISSRLVSKDNPRMSNSGIALDKLVDNSTKQGIDLKEKSNYIESTQNPPGSTAQGNSMNSSNNFEGNYNSKPSPSPYLIIVLKKNLPNGQDKQDESNQISQESPSKVHKSEGLNIDDTSEHRSKRNLSKPRAKSEVLTNLVETAKLDNDSAPLEAFMSTVIGAQDKKRQDSKYYLDPAMYPGRRISRCLSVSLKRSCTPDKMRIVIQTIQRKICKQKSPEKNRKLADISGKTPESKFVPKRNFRNIKVKALISFSTSTKK